MELINIPDKVEIIEEAAFGECHSLYLVNLPSALKKIDARAFECFVDSNKLKEIDIPEGTIEIGNSAFMGCPLERISIPETVKYIKNGAFSGNKFTKISLPRTLEQLEAGALNGGMFEEITIPDKITQIAEGLFSGCSNLKKVTMNGLVTEVGRDSFFMFYVRGHCATRRIGSNKMGRI